MANRPPARGADWRDVQPLNIEVKVVPAATFQPGTNVSAEHDWNVDVKFVTELVSIIGMVVSAAQPVHVWLSVVHAVSFQLFPEGVGMEARAEQPLKHC